ncbi:MAG: carboxypeptidase regulatory-like domain-containing protein [bacterium]|nr:carboxypeptidase regulatory-like domain-containing protein [Candidatus Kapabacteria bacterium]
MKRYFGIFAALFVTTLFVQSVTVDAADEKYTYAGTVTWRAGKVSAKKASHAMAGKPVAGARIRMAPGNYTATTDKNGRFTVKDIPRGSYTFHIKAKEHSSTTRIVVVNENEVDNELTLPWRNFRIGKADRKVEG